MCAQFILRSRVADINKAFGLSLPEDLLFEETRFMPYSYAPVVLDTVEGRELRDMNFSLIPSWSKEKKVRFATHNARLFSTDEKTGASLAIYEKPTWKKPFLTRHCIVPMTSFVEPIYKNKFAGNMVKFNDSADQLLFAAGIWDEWTDKSTGEVIDSFSIITDDPPGFVYDIGHDRCPLFLKPTALKDWLTVSKTPRPGDLVEFLRSERATIQFKVETDRPLKAGWQKRIPQ